MTDAVTLSLTANPSELFDVIAKCENQDALAMSIGSAVMNGLLGGLHWSDAVNLSVLKITASSADQTAPSSPGDGWEPRPSTGGQATIIDGKIEISIDVAALPMIVNGSCLCDSMEGLWKVTDAETFAKEVCQALNDEHEDGTTRVHMMFDAAFMEAINQGAEGIEEVDEEAFVDETARLMARPLPAAPSPGGDHGA